MTKKIFVLIIALLMLFSTACTQEKNVKGIESSTYKMGDVKNVKVTAGQANVRTGCSKDTPVIETSDKNSVLDVISKVANWYAVKLPDNKIGFVPEDECKPVIVDGKDKQPGAGTGTQQPSPSPGGGNGTNEGQGDGGEPEIPDDTQSNNTTLSEHENEMLRLVNEARTQNNVPPLEVDMELVNVARIKSQDMIDNNYFSHNSPTYGSPFDMMKDFGIEYVQAGENIAGNRDVKRAHDSLMNSPGHRKNILKKEFTHVGIGIKDGGNYGKMFTQMFISKPK